MPVSFPPSDHIHLERPPLKEVVCQVRFPLLLRLTQQVPVDFQDMIRERFPTPKIDNELLLTLPPDPSQSIRPEAGPTVYRFSDITGVRTVSLSAGFYAFSTTKYESWETFADDLKFATQAVISTYDIQYSTRVGLRYINMLNVTNTNVGSFSDVLALMRPELTALVRAKEIQEPDFSVTHVSTTHDDGVFSFRSGIVQEEGQPGLRSFALDFDQYIEANMKLVADDLMNRCDRYHALIYNAFRWCIVGDNIAVFDPQG